MFTLYSTKAVRTLDENLCAPEASTLPRCTTRAIPNMIDLTGDCWAIVQDAKSMVLLNSTYAENPTD